MLIALSVSPVGAQLDGAQMAAAREKAQVCFACHGPDGNSTVPDYPILAQQSWRYIFIQLQDFAAGRRTDPHKPPMAAQLSTDDMMALGFFFAAQKQLPIQFKVDPAKVEAGRKTADTVLCPMCHLGGFVGRTRSLALRVSGPSTSRSSSRTSRRSDARTTPGT